MVASIPDRCSFVREMFSSAIVVRSSLAMERSSMFSILSFSIGKSPVLGGGFVSNGCFCCLLYGLSGSATMPVAVVSL